jgi:hypothetical protein
LANPNDVLANPNVSKHPAHSAAEERVLWPAESLPRKDLPRPAVGSADHSLQPPHGLKSMGAIPAVEYMWTGVFKSGRKRGFEPVWLT